MKANTALLLALTGIALLIRTATKPAMGVLRFAKASAGLVSVIGFATFAEYLLSLNFGIDQVLFTDSSPTSNTSHPGRMSPVTALEFVLLGGVLIAPDDARWDRLTGAVTTLAAIVALIALAGYLYSVEALYHIHPFTSIALHTSASLFALGVGILLSRPERGLAGLLTSDSQGGFMARRLFPLAIGTPLILGWLRYMGERAGLYGTGFGIALFAVSNVVLLGAFVTWTAEALRRTDLGRKRAEERFRMTVESAPNAMVLVDKAGQIALVNLQAERLFGFDRTELLGQPIELLLPERFRAHHPRFRTDFLASPHSRLGGAGRDLFGLRKDGTEVPVEIGLQQMRTEEGDFVLAVIVDITERKRSEAAIQTAEARLRCLAEANLIGIIVANLQGDILDANPAFLQMVGYTREDVVSGKVRWADMTPPEYSGLDERAIGQLKATGVATPWAKEYIRKDGSRVPILVGVSLVKGETDKCIAFILDQSERKELEDQLRQAHKMEVIGRLAGGVAHDFNNLLTPIISYSDMILGRMSPDDPSYQELDEVRKAGFRASALTRQLLAFSRKQVLQPKVTDLNGLITEATKLLRSLIGEDVSLTLALAPSLRPVLVDPNQVEQVLMNLAVNARDAMPRGGTLTIETMNVDLGSEYAASHAEVMPGPFAMVAVSDTGTGMSKETLAHVFEPFFTTKERGKGTGLGLPTVHGIVKQSRGHVWVYSEIGRGTTFKLYFPEAMGKSKERSTAVQQRPPARGTETVLLAEDDVTLRILAAKVLRLAGYSVLEAKDGESALVMSKTHQGTIDLLITDVVMPGVSGREAAQQILTMRPRMKVLYISGYSENAIVHHGVLDQGTELLEKPFTPYTLTQKVRAILDSGNQAPPMPPSIGLESR